MEDKGCLNYGRAQELSGSSATMSFEFHKGNGANRSSHHRMAFGKPTPLKWDDAQKWLGNHLSRGGEKNQSKSTPRNSNADDRRLIAPVPKEEYLSSEDQGGNAFPGIPSSVHYEVETKDMDCDESVWRINKPSTGSVSVVRSICVRDMGTEMTPAASQEPSRTATPLKSTTPAARSPITSGSSTPLRYQNGFQISEDGQTPTGITSAEHRGEAGRGNGSSTSRFAREGEELNAANMSESRSDQPQRLNPLETRAMAWDEAERAKYLARYKREEVKIQAWENHEKRRAEMEMRRMEVKAERLKSRAQEKYTNKLAATKRIAEEKRANAESKLNEKAVKTSEKADYIRRTGHMPSSFSFKLPSFCW
ncbi:remorin 1.4 [Coffea eugenioides]|uniref:Remorin 1.4 n=1 Tax=Coffea arabica TaxID=13443 RepID=A0A6P6VCZ5_COFAR|nr:remorin 1.4 [Coffea arabica]XP_027153967.1 remorin 1.4 [Coffea eugenioides]